MSESSFSGQATLAQTQRFRRAPDYQLSDDLAKLCLPSEYKDECRFLAWINSICFLFLVIGLVGLNAPKPIIRPLAEVAETMPVELPPPQEQPKPPPEVQQEEQEPQETPTETPQVAVVVAAADPSQVAFAVPVVGAVAVKEARFATPPPPITQTAPKLTKFDPNATTGDFPEPQYPPVAWRAHHEGTVMVEIDVDANGTITAVKLHKSSGFPGPGDLDDWTIKHVKSRWHFRPGQPGAYLKPFIYQLKSG